MNSYPATALYLSNLTCIDMYMPVHEYGFLQVGYLGCTGLYQATASFVWSHKP